MTRDVIQPYRDDATVVRKVLKVLDRLRRDISSPEAALYLSVTQH